jgi:hypothetical protein
MKDGLLKCLLVVAHAQMRAAAVGVGRAIFCWQVADQAGCSYTTQK